MPSAYQVYMKDKKCKGEAEMNWRDRFNQFMYGRYGQDEMGRFLLIVALVALILDLLFPPPGGGLVILLLLGYIYFRMFSRNVPARYAENQKFLQLRDKVTGFFRGSKGRSEDLKMNHIFRCPKCSQKIRIPRGKGMVEITCPKCGTRFRKRS